MDERVRSVAGHFNAQGLRFGVAAARFNELIVERLVAGAIDTLQRHGVDPAHITLVHVPGAFEIPVALKKLASSGQYDALLALGCVIRGATPHFDYVSAAASQGISQAALEHELPVGFGLLTVDTIDQAIERAGTKAGNKGADAAMAAIEMATLLHSLEQ